MPAEHQGPQQLTARRHRGHPVVPVLYRAPVGAGRFEVVVPELDRAVEDFGQRGSHIMDAATAQDDLGQPVVDLRRTLDDATVVPDDLVGPLQLGEGGTGLGQQVRGVDGDGGMRGERGEQRDLFPFEDSRAAVRREEHTDDLAAEHQRNSEDRDQALVADGGVDRPGVLEAGVVEIAVGDIRPCGLGDEPAEPLPHAKAQLLEAC